MHAWVVLPCWRPRCQQPSNRSQGGARCATLAAFRLRFAGHSRLWPGLLDALENCAINSRCINDRMASRSLRRNRGRSGAARARVRQVTTHPARHGSTAARSVDEVARIQVTLSHYAPVLIAPLSTVAPACRECFFWGTSSAMITDAPFRTMHHEIAQFLAHPTIQSHPYRLDAGARTAVSIQFPNTRFIVNVTDCLSCYLSTATKASNDGEDAIALTARVSCFHSRSPAAERIDRARRWFRTRCRRPCGILFACKETSDVYNSLLQRNQSGGFTSGVQLSSRPLAGKKSRQVRIPGAATQTRVLRGRDWVQIRGNPRKLQRDNLRQNFPV